MSFRGAVVKILVLYGTTEGHTRKVAQFVAERLATHGFATTLVEAVGEGPDLPLRSFAAVLVAASLHQGQYQPAVVRWLSRSQDALKTLPSAFMSVSLSAAGHDPEDEHGLQACISALEAQTGWHPPQVHHVAGAFKFTQYDFLKRWALKYVAYRRGQPTDTNRDYELTDWADLQTFVDQFSAILAAGSKGSGLRAAPQNSGSRGR
jgi:menaquinone-dependent protoporphyrinogen oxidase